jgi:hypothetical protein
LIDCNEKSQLLLLAREEAGNLDRSTIFYNYGATVCYFSGQGSSLSSICCNILVIITTKAERAAAAAVGITNFQPGDPRIVVIIDILFDSS